MRELPSWVSFYRRQNTTREDGERELIERLPIDGEFSRAAIAGDNETKLNTISLLELAHVYGRANGLVRVLYALKDLHHLLDAPASLGYPFIPLFIHYNLYGVSEYAHASKEEPYYNSFNLGRTRVRALLLGTMRGEAHATAALTDLALHELAHITDPRRRAKTIKHEHDCYFYLEKERLKSQLIDSLKESPELDPFGFSAYGVPLTLPQAAELLVHFPDRKVTQNRG